jgi:hypothetical protein
MQIWDMSARFKNCEDPNTKYNTAIGNQLAECTDIIPSYRRGRARAAGEKPSEGHHETQIVQSEPIYQLGFLAPPHFRRTASHMRLLSSRTAPPPRL